MGEFLVGRCLPRDEDASEVVGPGEVEVDGMADNAQGHREECRHQDGPVLVGQQVLLLTASPRFVNFSDFLRTIENLSNFCKK